MNEEDFWEKLPTAYDCFYYDSWIASKLCELSPVKKFLKEYEIDLENIYYGYLYLFELVITSLVNHIEDLIEDVNVSELIHWGDVSTENKDLIELIREHSEIKFILSILVLRKRFSSLRFREIYDEKEIISQLNNSKETLDRLNEFLITKYKILKIDVGKEQERMLILNWILNKYNYIEAYFDFFAEDERDPIPIWPGLPFFYLMPDNVRKNYHLQNPKIKSKEENYLKGFSLTLLYLYKNLIPEQINKFEKDILNVKNWTELHKLGSRIHDEIVKDHKIFLKLFNMTQKPKKATLRKEKIENYEELRLVLRGRAVRVITDRFSGDYPNTQSLFLHALFGAIEMYRCNLRDKPEIIEFKQIYEDGNWIEYSYAIYIPVAGALWDASHWLVFNKLCVESSWEPHDFFKMMIDSYVRIFKEEGKLSFHRYEIKGDLLKRYIEKNDFEIRAKKHREEELKVCKGLLGEFLAGFYLIKKEKVASIIELDFHRDLKSTDIDVVGETEYGIVIVQVKSNLTFNQDEHKNILNHFNRVLKNIDIKGKKVKKILFILNDNIPEAEIDELWKDQEISKRGMIREQDIEDKKRKTIDLFQKEGVKTKFLKDLKEELKHEEGYSDLLSKLNIVFPKTEEEDDNAQT